MSCEQCGQDYRATHDVGSGTGYAKTADGKTICYDCCADRDRTTMIETGSSKTLPLYLGEGEVTNWPGTLRFPVDLQRNGRHNIARTRVDVWFKGPDGKPWHGTQYGNNTQIVHCNRLSA